MTLRTLMALAALAASQQSPPSPPPAYPAPSLRFPYFSGPDRSDVLADAQLSYLDDERAAPALGGRMRLGGWGYVGGQLGEQRSELALTTWRGELRAAEERGRLEMSSVYHARRLRGQAELVRRRDDEGAGWVLRVEGGFRVDPDLEIAAGFQDDSDSRTVGIAERYLGSEFVRVRYQRGTHLEAEARGTRFRRRTVGGINVDGQLVDVSTVGVLRGVELRGAFSYQWLTGPLGRELGSFDMDVIAPVPLLPRLVLNGGTSQRWEGDVRRFDDGLRLGVDFYARRYRVARDGAAAARTLSLARRAAALGLNESRVFTEPERRAFRERLALSPAAAELRDEIDLLHLAEIEERNVPLLGFGWERRHDAIEGHESRTYRATFGIPWPLALPFTHDDSAVRFLTVSFAHTDHVYDSGFTSRNREAVVELELNREVGLRFRWAEPDRSPVHAALRRGPAPRIELAMFYALGR